MGTSKKDSLGGDPAGKKRLKKLTLCFLKPIKIEPKNTVQDKRNVIKIWLVIA